MRFLLGLLILSSAASAQEAELSLEWNKSGKPVLILGESAHNDQRAILLLKRLITLESETLDFVALEADSSQQSLVDAYLLSNLPPPQKLRGAAIRDLSLLQLIRALNLDRRDQGLKPISVILLDLPGAGYSSNANWFADRDRHMFETLRRGTNGLSQRGIIFAGSGHAAKQPFELPKPLRWNTSPFTKIEPLGSYSPLKENALAVFVQNDFTWMEMGLMAIFRDTRPFLKMWRLMKTSAGEMISTQDEEFQWAESHTGLTDKTPMRISTHFDFWVRPEMSCASAAVP